METPWLPKKQVVRESHPVSENKNQLTMKTNSTKVAIVTGSSRGIGAAIAKRLASDGLAVVVNYAGRVADAEKVVQEIQAAGGQAVAVKADVSVPAEVATLFDKAEEAFGGVDVVVNNAGIMQQGLVPLADTDDALFDRLFAPWALQHLVSTTLISVRLASPPPAQNPHSSKKPPAISPHPPGPPPPTTRRLSPPPPARFPPPRPPSPFLSPLPPSLPLFSSSPPPPPVPPLSSFFISPPPR